MTDKENTWRNKKKREINGERKKQNIGWNKEGDIENQKREWDSEKEREKVHVATTKKKKKKKKSKCGKKEKHRKEASGKKKA